MTNMLPPISFLLPTLNGIIFRVWSCWKCHPRAPFLQRHSLTQPPIANSVRPRPPASSWAAASRHQGPAPGDLCSCLGTSSRNLGLFLIRSFLSHASFRKLLSGLPTPQVPSLKVLSPWSKLGEVVCFVSNLSHRSQLKPEIYFHGNLFSIHFPRRI